MRTGVSPSQRRALTEALRHAEKERQEYFRSIKEPRKTKKSKDSLVVTVGDFAMGLLIAMLVCLLLGIGGMLTAN